MLQHISVHAPSFYVLADMAYTVQYSPTAMWSCYYFIIQHINLLFLSKINLKLNLNATISSKKTVIGMGLNKQKF